MQNLFRDFPAAPHRLIMNKHKSLHEKVARGKDPPAVKNRLLVEIIRPIRQSQKGLWATAGVAYGVKHPKKRRQLHLFDNKYLDRKPPLPAGNLTCVHDEVK